MTRPHWFDYVAERRTKFASLCAATSHKVRIYDHITGKDKLVEIGDLIYLGVPNYAEKSIKLSDLKPIVEAMNKGGTK